MINETAEALVQMYVCMPLGCLDVLVAAAASPSSLAFLHSGCTSLTYAMLLGL